MSDVEPAQQIGPQPAEAGHGSEDGGGNYESAGYYGGPYGRSAPYKKTLCRHWQAGNCRNGHRCTFSHGIEDLKGTRGILCRFFVRGVCKHGANCPYMHPSGSRMALPSEVGPSPYYSVTGSGPQYPQPPTGYKTDLCVNRSGQCSAGVYCGFAHSVDELLPGKFSVEEIAALRQAAAASNNSQSVSPYGQYYAVAVRDGGAYGHLGTSSVVATAPTTVVTGRSEQPNPYGGYSYPTTYSATPQQIQVSNVATAGARHTELYFPAAGSTASSPSASGYHMQHPGAVSSDPVADRPVMLPTSRKLCNFWPHGCRKGDACPFVHEASLVHPAATGADEADLGRVRRIAEGWGPSGIGNVASIYRGDASEATRARSVTIGSKLRDTVEG
ncbi:putative zinc finger (CCCH type) protein [Neospora caninum Liverpool]|uniref:Putative zinc finger (CCCH type) protein n=1 Tax=Neospora caninum (strain Liverpool) TaxID=572307 RepID=F0VJT5_NEOCL|nr:putative zinc finger (CCCH type) protein [Neospora caninum Liverpool]CBZ53996.1 putative zinc finger (CCCH type) protein [Neospora caninum Liverpool]|eukprot:XP_003884028.1 putative zinc finger (CCCH type) protein [Neospora caninum Liverpool]